MSDPQISLINYIYIPPNTTSNNMLEIADSGANIHPEKYATPTIPPAMMENDMKARLPDGSTANYSQIAKL